MSAEAHKLIIRRLVEDSFNPQNLDLLNELVDPSYVDHGPFPEQSPGIAGMKEAHEALYAGFPDVQQSIDDLIAEGDRVMVRWTCRGTHKGEFMDIPPTGRYIAVTGIDIFRLENGKVMECWHNLDELGMLAQLGVVPGRSLLLIRLRWIVSNLVQKFGRYTRVVKKADAGG
jgi:predicted ester cyclase